MKRIITLFGLLSLFATSLVSAADPVADGFDLAAHLDAKKPQNTCPIEGALPRVLPAPRPVPAVCKAGQPASVSVPEVAREPLRSNSNPFPFGWSDPCDTQPCFTMPRSMAPLEKPSLINPGSTLCVGSGATIPGAQSGLLYCKTEGNPSGEACGFLGVSTPVIGPAITYMTCPSSGTQSVCVGAGIDTSVVGVNGSFCFESTPGQFSIRSSAGGNVGPVFGSVSAPPMITFGR